jgi:hypothetical protein
MRTDKDVVLATALVQELRLEKVVFASPQCDRAHLCAGDHARESQDLLTLAETLNEGHRVMPEGTFAATYGIDFQHAGLVATNARCARRQACIETPSRTVVRI